MNKFDVFLQKTSIFIFFRRRFIENVVYRYFKEYSRKLKNKTILEVGCATGFGTIIINKYFSPKKIIAIDLDERFINIAKKNIKNSSVVFEVADATRLKYSDYAFDAIFEFGVIHHIPNWKDCLEELYRVLKPKGKIFIYDVSIESFQGLYGRFIRSFTLHPYEQMYKEKEFINYIRKLGFRILNLKSKITFGRYFAIVGEK